MEFLRVLFPEFTFPENESDVNEFKYWVHTTSNGCYENLEYISVIIDTFIIVELFHVLSKNVFRSCFNRHWCFSGGKINFHKRLPSIILKHASKKKFEKLPSKLRISTLYGCAIFISIEKLFITFVLVHKNSSCSCFTSLFVCIVQTLFTLLYKH